MRGVGGFFGQDGQDFGINGIGVDFDVRFPDSLQGALHMDGAWVFFQVKAGTLLKPTGKKRESELQRLPTKEREFLAAKPVSCVLAESVRKRSTEKPTVSWPLRPERYRAVQQVRRQLP